MFRKCLSSVFDVRIVDKCVSLLVSEGEMFEFHIVSLDNKQWLFEASSAEERDDWVGAVEQQILNSLQVR